MAGHSSRVLDRPCYNSQVSNKLCYSSWTNQCYSSMLFRKRQENSSSRREGMRTQIREEKNAPASGSGGGVGWGAWGGADREKEHTHAGERESALAPPFICFFFFSSPWACPVQIGLSQECCLFYLRSSLWSSDLPLFYFRRLLPSLSFSHCHFGLLFPSLAI